MKTITDGKVVARCDEKTAREAVKTGKWRYVAKRFHKTPHDGLPSLPLHEWKKKGDKK